MKKSIFGKIGAAAVVLTLVTGSLVGGTFAKYTSTVTGTGKATVAAWKIAMKEGEKNAITSDKFNFDLINLNSGAASEDGKIAPGSKGEIQFTIDGTGTQVEYTYSVSADITSLGSVPIKFYSDEARTPDKEITFTGNTAEVASGEVLLDSESKVKTASIYWAWDSTTDTADTTLGEAETAITGTIDVSITATQKVPTL